ncbi:OTU family ubiquitin thioesterase [Pseudomonas brassicacearum]|uniref:OTU family ubiquitin thioesterase n=1 Tax=Pseudomonas brassicacearum TaxID=930166 RepID=UPI00218200AD|nr:OTU family ubiquitin thioesterase [Pseudomonas brassicacearum]
MSIFPNDEPGSASPGPRSDATDAQAREQLRQLDLLDTHQIQLARLFAAVPTFDTVIANLLVSLLKARIAPQTFRPSLLANLEPDHCYVNRFTTSPSGERTLTSSERFTQVLRNSLLTDTAPAFANGGVGFFTRPGSLEEGDSLFAGALDGPTLRALETVFHIAHPPTNEQVKREFRDELARFRQRQNWEASLGVTASSTTQAALAQLLCRRFLHLFDLYKADRDPVAQPSHSARIQQSDDDRLLDLIITHPSQADRSRLSRAPVPHVYAVMLDHGAAQPKKWPAAMVIRFTDRPSLFLYSLERGLQRFEAFQDLVSRVRPFLDGQERRIQDISTELSGHVFEVAAADLLQMQGAALEKVLDAPANATVAVSDFARLTEDALGLPSLSLAGPLAARQEALIERQRPAFYKRATPAEQAHYRRLETQVFDAVYALGSDVPTLVQFTRQKIKQYLRQTLHPRIDVDPDRTQVRLSYGDKANPRQSRTSSLTQLMLDNLRAPQYPNAMREVLAVYLIDRHGQRIRHPDSGFSITVTGPELASMATSIDAGGNYEILLRQRMNEPRYKAAWQAAYRASLAFKGYEASLQGDAVFKAKVIDPVAKPAHPRKLLASWLEAVLQSPTVAERAWVGGRRVHVHGLLLGGSVDGQGNAPRNALSIDGALIFSDQAGPDIKGTVGVYLPDSPEGNDLHEFADLSDGITGLLQQEEWRTYFRSRISALDQEQVKRALGQHRGRPLIRGWLISSDWLENFHRAHVNFQSAYADHRSNSNRDIGLQTTARLVMMAVEIVMDLAGLLLIPGFQMLARAVRTGLLVLKTGAVPTNTTTLAFVHAVANTRKTTGLGGVSFNVRGGSSFLAVTARQNQAGAPFGLPLETALYRRYAVADTTVLRGVSADARGFYRPAITDSATGSVARRVYVQQPDGVVFRVHDHTPLGAIEATIVDPVSGSNIRASGVMRSTVARAPDGQWHAVGFGLGGGGKRPSGGPPQPGPSAPKQPSTSLRAVANLIRTPNAWDVEIMDLVPSLITRLPSWPQNRSLLIIDQRPGQRDWSIRFTPGQVESGYPTGTHPLRSDTDVVLIRTGENHYSLRLAGDTDVTFDPDGNCFFNAVARGLNEGQSPQTFSMQRLRNETAAYIERHPEMGQYLIAPPTGLQQALADNARSLEHLMGKAAVFDVSQIVYGTGNPHNLFQPLVNFLKLYADDVARRTLNNAWNADLPPEVLRHIGSYLSPRAPGRPILSSVPYYTQTDQALRTFFEDTLLPPIERAAIVELLNNEYLMFSQDVVHIMLEYGIKARELTDHHPRNSLAYVRYDEALHGHLNEMQLDEALNGAYLVDSEDLKKAKRRYEQETGNLMDDDADLLEQHIYYDRADDLVDLLTVALERFPVLQARANILLKSPVIASNLGGLFPVSLLSQWIRTPSISNTRLHLIGDYASGHYDELTRYGAIDINWMRPFDDWNLHSLFTHRQALLDFFGFLQEVRYFKDSDLSAVARLFAMPGQPLSNSRVAILFNRPNLWVSIRSMRGITRDGARAIWHDLIGPQFSDDNIRFALGRPGSLDSESALTGALIDSLVNDEGRAHRLILGAYAMTERQAQYFLYNFDFSASLAGHSRLDFASYVSAHGAIPQWAWPYARSGVTPEVLKPFLATRKPPES